MSTTDPITQPVITSDPPTGSTNDSEPEAEVTPLPQKVNRRLRQALVIAGVVVAIATISFLSFSWAATSNAEGHYHSQLAKANATIKTQNSSIDATTNNLNKALATLSTDQSTIAAAKADIVNANNQINNNQTVIGQLNTQISQDQSTIDNLQGQLNYEDEVPPGGYGNFQSDLINDLSNQDSVSASTVDCVLPSAWTPGQTFDCDIFDSNNTYLGYTNITIDSNNPNGSPQWEFTWYPSSDGQGAGF
jgi:ABC-type transporter Mla subunit MlaD